MPAQTEGGAEGILLPLIDILNHSPDAAMSWVAVRDQSTSSAPEAGIALFAEMPDTDDACEVVVQRAGAELCNNYGSQSNSAMLLKYGFCLEENRADTVVMWLDVHESNAGTTLFDHQLAMLRGAEVQIKVTEDADANTHSEKSSDDSESDLDDDDGNRAAGTRVAVVGPFVLTKTGAPCYEGTGKTTKYSYPTSDAGVPTELLVAIAVLATRSVSRNMQQPAVTTSVLSRAAFLCTEMLEEIPTEEGAQLMSVGTSNGLQAQERQKRWWWMRTAALYRAGQRRVLTDAIALVNGLAGINTRGDARGCMPPAALIQATANAVLL